MRWRVGAALLLAAALLVHVGWTRRFRAEGAAAADEYGRLREERRQALADHARAVRLSEAPGRVGVVRGASAQTPPARAARRLVVDALAGSGVSTVRLRVDPGGKGPVGASVRLTGVGALDEVARFAGDLARPGNGLVLSSVALQPRAGAVELSFEALALGPL